MDQYKDSSFILDEAVRYQRQVIAYFVQKLSQLETESPEAAFLRREGFYRGPYRDTLGNIGAAEVDDILSAATPVFKNAITHGFNGGAMRFMNTPAFDALRGTFGLDAGIRPARFSDEQIAHADRLRDYARKT